MRQFHPISHQKKPRGFQGNNLLMPGSLLHQLRDGVRIMVVISSSKYRRIEVYGSVWSHSSNTRIWDLISLSLYACIYIYIFFMNYVYIYIFADLELKLLQNASFFVWQLPFGLVHTSACHIQFFPCVSCRLNWEGIIFTANNCIAITCGNRFLEMYENYGPPEDVCCWKGNNKFLQLQIFMSPFLILEGESHTVPTSDLKYSLDEPPRVPPKNHTRPSWT